MSNRTGKATAAHLVRTGGLVGAGGLGLGDQGVQSLTPAGPAGFLEGEDVAQQDPAVTAGLVEGDLAVVEHAHQGRAGHAEQVGGLLGGQSLVVRSDGDGLTRGSPTGWVDDDASGEHARDRHGRRRGAWVPPGRFCWDGSVTTVEDVTALVDRLRRDRRRDPHARRREYSQAARDLAAGCADLIAAGEAAAAGPVLRTAVNRMTTALMYLDDSSGIVGDDLHEIMTLYARACAAAPPNPKTLAGWLVKLECDGPGWPEIRLREFAAALGEAGIAEVARLVEQRAATADPGSWTQTFAVRDLREQVAEVSGDVDRYVAVLAEHLASIHQYRRIVAALRQAGSITDALDWARRGLAAKPGWPEADGLRDALVELLCETGQAEQAMVVRREEFIRHPTLTTWRALAATAGTVGTGDGSSLRAWALTVLRQRAEQNPLFLRELVEVLLDVGEPETAWRTSAGRHDDLGPQLLLRLLEMRRATHPEQTVQTYRELVEDKILDGRDKYRYRRAVALLRELRLAHLAIGDLAGFTGYLDDLRTRHRRRPTFLTTLDKARWSS